MPVLGVASKLRQPAVGSKPLHSALPMPSLGTPAAQQYSARSLELSGAESSMLSCQLGLKSTCDFGERRTLQGRTQELEDSKRFGSHFMEISVASVNRGPAPGECQIGVFPPGATRRSLILMQLINTQHIQTTLTQFVGDEEYVAL